MPIVSPSILAPNEDRYRKQIERVAHFARRIQIDLTDGIFASPKTLDTKKIWWPVGIKADVHLMYKNPGSAIKELLRHNPHMIIVHAEASGNFEEFAELCHAHKVKIGVALLQNTAVEKILPALHYIDHVLIFAGELGHYGGRADLTQTSKIKILKQNKADIEVGWDGGINDQNISELAFAGIDVFDVGGFIQESEDPEKAYEILERIADETGTT